MDTTGGTVGALGGYVREPVGEESAPDLPPALDVAGPEVARVVALARDVTVCFGLTVEEAGERRNVALCVSGDGILGRHDKVHLPPAERFAFTPGDRFAAFDTPVGRLGEGRRPRRRGPRADRPARRAYVAHVTPDQVLDSATGG